MTRKNEMTLAELTENIYDLTAGTGFAHLAQSELKEYLKDKNIELDWTAGLITITDEDTGEDIYEITITISKM